MGFSLDEILAVTRGKLIQASRVSRVRGVSTDTRTLKKGEAFVAIRGEKCDGHDHLKVALQKGASLLIVDRKKTALPKGVAAFRVKDSVKALGAIAHFHRQRFDIPVIAITGSAGKTTTKEMMRAVLSTRYKVLSNQGTFNNHIGVPLTLLKMNARHEVAVIEAGTSGKGEIAYLARMIAPTIAVFTNIGASHLKGLDTLAGVFREKKDLLHYTDRKGAVVFDQDDLYLRRIKGMKVSQRLVTCARKGKAKLRPEKVEHQDGRTLFRLSGKQYTLNSMSPGDLSNALAAIACGQLLKVSRSGIQKGIERYRPANGRQEFRRVAGVTLIDDTYNANPTSFRNAIRVLASIRTSGQRVLVAGDMLELGARSIDLHRTVGRFAAQESVDHILTFGRKAREIGRAARKVSRNITVSHAMENEEVVRSLKTLVHRGDVVLIKGSRGMHMEKVVRALAAYLKGR